MPCNGPYHSFRIKAINSPPVRRSAFRSHECNGGLPSRQALLDHQNGHEKRNPNRSDPQKYPRRHVQPPTVLKPEEDAPSNLSERGVSPVAAASSCRYSPYRRSKAVKLEPAEEEVSSPYQRSIAVKLEPKEEVVSGNASPERFMAVKLEPDVKIEPKEEVAAAAPGENNNGDEADSENERDKLN